MRERESEREKEAEGEREMGGQRRYRVVVASHSCKHHKWPFDVVGRFKVALAT